MRTKYLIHLPVFLLAFLTANGVNTTWDPVHWEKSLIEKAAVKPAKTPEFLKKSTPTTWAKAVLDTLSTKEKIGQLFMVAAYSNRGADHLAELRKQVKDHGIGGLIFFQGGPGREIAMQNELQQAAKIPLLIGIDAEWGLNMRLDSTVGFQRQMTMGATHNPILIQEAATEIAAQCRALGIHINFAPVCDVNSNPKNPVINTRSFGEDRFWVSKLSTAYARGLESKGVMACAKHFPGHGDTDSDSHKTLPTVNQSLARLDSIELYPFKELFNYGVSSVMVAHLNIPSLDNSGTPSTLSTKVVHDLLKDSMKFEGLVFTDALNMRGVADAFPPGITDLKAFAAGADVLLFPMDVPKAIAEISSAIEKGEIPMSRLDEACLKVLIAKEKFINNAGRVDGMQAFNAVQKKNRVGALRQKIADASITLLKQDGIDFPLNPFAEHLVISVDGVARFGEEVKKVAPITAVSVNGSADVAGLKKEIAKAESFTIALGGSYYKRSNNYGLDADAIKVLKSLAKETQPKVLVWFGNPYALSEVDADLLDAFSAIVVGYERAREQYFAVGEKLFGKAAFEGKLPVSINDRFSVNDGIQTQLKGFPVKARPERQGMSGERLNWIDSLIEREIDLKSTPGCRILVMRKGKEVYNKSFGHYTYAKKNPVGKNTIYDLASLTKMLGTGLACMKLYEEGVLNLDLGLGDYLSFIPQTSPYYNIKLRDVMLHQARLAPWIPYFQDFVKPDSTTLSLVVDKQSTTHPVRVADNYYVSFAVQDWIWQRILNEPLRRRKEYKYSDLGFYFLKAIIEEITNKPLNKYLAESFYDPMGLETLGYLPRNRFALSAIAPTEYDIAWRKQLIVGDVHDQGAALLGGVGGHAGLFGTAEDVAAIMQMLLDGGVFNGKQYLKASTVNYFTKTQENPDDNRRGLIFDKPVRDGGPGPTFDGISFDSFGHSGFTGTLAWADPVEDIVYVFLSNRIYPSSENKKLIRNNVRSVVQEMIYDAIIEPKTAELKN